MLVCQKVNKASSVRFPHVPRTAAANVTGQLCADPTSPWKWHVRLATCFAKRFDVAARWCPPNDINLVYNHYSLINYGYIYHRPKLLELQN
jgi:hypothetical protein